MAAKALANRIRPLFDRVLIKRIQPPKQTASGLFLPDSAANNEISQGIVESVGPGARNENGEIVPLSLKVGDQVILPQYGGQEFKIDDDEFVLCRDAEVVATIAPEK